MKKFRSLLIAALLIAGGAKMFAADATVTFVSGKVEVLRNEKWVPLQKGDAVKKSEMISTGFQSEAKIKILDSVMYLGPVTRITIEELSSSGSKDNVNVYLKTGTARSQVKHVDNKRVDYKVHTAIAVASCRGTDWTIDDSNAVECYEGTVAVAAYIPPEAGSEGTSTDNEETEGKGGTEAEETSGAEGGEEGGASGSDESSTPTTADGVLVKANQSVKVSRTADVSAPVSNVVKAANTIVAAVATAAAKEAVTASAGSKTSAAATVLSDSVKDAFKDVLKDPTKEEEPVKTGSVVVSFDIPE